MMTSTVRVLLWLLRILLFVALFGLAVKNGAPMELHFFFNQVWVAPVSVVVLAVFLVGAVFGLATALGMMSRLKRNA